MVLLTENLIGTGSLVLLTENGVIFSLSRQEVSIEYVCVCVCGVVWCV